MKNALVHAAILLTLGGLCYFEVQDAARRHRSDEEVDHLVQEGLGDERIEALFLRANRSSKPTVSGAALRELLQGEDALWAEWAMSTSVVRHTGTQRQERFLKGLKDPELVLRCRFYLDQQRRRGRRSMNREDLVRFLETLDSSTAEGGR